ncbi:MAG: hypothetical protein Q9166_004982 [cf. Caloplaca sp. 2 TL-2023]
MNPPSTQTQHNRERRRRSYQAATAETQQAPSPFWTTTLTGLGMALAADLRYQEARIQSNPPHYREGQRAPKRIGIAGVMARPDAATGTYQTLPRSRVAAVSTGAYRRVGGNTSDGQSSYRADQLAYASLAKYETDSKAVGGKVNNSDHRNQETSLRDHQVPAYPDIVRDAAWNNFKRIHMEHKQAASGFVEQQRIVDQA